MPAEAVVEGDVEPTDSSRALPVERAGDGEEARHPQPDPGRHDGEEGDLRTRTEGLGARRLSMRALCRCSPCESSAAASPLPLRPLSRAPNRALHISASSRLHLTSISRASLSRGSANETRERTQTAASKTLPHCPQKAARWRTIRSAVSPNRPAVR